MEILNPTELADKYRYVPLWIYRQECWRLDFEELQGAGYWGLVQAANRFDESLGLTFMTYATRRVRGAMRDHERSWFKMQGKNHRDAPACLDLLPLDLLPVSQPVSTSELDREQLTLKVDGVLDSLRPQERWVLKMLFWEEQTPSQIAATLGVTESRVFQIRRMAFQKLRPQLEGVA